MNRPMFVLLLLKIVEITNRTIISRKLIIAIMEPIIVSQFFVERGSFIFGRVFRVAGGKNKKILNPLSD
jgi:hypothetical protein